MTLFKRKPEKTKAPVLVAIDSRVQEAREGHHLSFFYPLKRDEVDLVRAYFLRTYRGLVELDHKTDNKFFYKFYGYSLD